MHLVMLRLPGAVIQANDRKMSEGNEFSVGIVLRQMCLLEAGRCFNENLTSA